MGVIDLSGAMTCPPDRLDTVHTALADHIAATRSEPDCLSFEEIETAVGVLNVVETFQDRSAFEAHQARAASSNWGALLPDFPKNMS